MEDRVLAEISAAIRDATRQPLKLRAALPVRGGDINECYRLEGTDGERYFLKLNDARHHAMFIAEAEGLNALAATNTIRVPRPIAHGTANSRSFLVLEYLELSSCGDARRLGEQLAALHRHLSPPLPCREITSDLPACGLSRMARSYIRAGERVETPSLQVSCGFGFAQDNFIGTTPQPNAWKDDWIDFWRERRLGFQLELANRNGYGGELQQLGARLMEMLPAFFVGYTPQPSLLHGDLWGGNHGFLADGIPVIFDPAAYYGDRECDLAMTELFGGYGSGFYAAYRASWSLDAGYEVRKNLYNLYHILNHVNLFGGDGCDSLLAKPADCGSLLVALPHQRATPHRVRATGYARQAIGMMERLLVSCP